MLHVAACLGLLVALCCQSLAEGSHHQVHVHRVSVVAHHTHAPHFTHRGAKTTRNLEVVLVHGKATQLSGINSLRHADGVDRGQAALGILDKSLQPELALQAVPQHLVHRLVPSPERLQALLARHRQRLAQRVKVADGAGVVVGALAIPPPVVSDELHVGVVGSHHGLAGLQLVHRLLRHEHGGGSRGSGQRLLRARVAHVYAPLVAVEGDAAQGAHRVHNQQGVRRLAQLAHAFNLLVCARRRLSLAQKQSLGFVLVQGSFELLQRVRLTRWLLHRHNLQVVARRQVAHACAPDAILPHQDLLPRFQHVGNGRLHGHVPGA
mmetsp:Transcript_29504/g.56675  ORF Transcript_29504/g.56675 Transcript_29504/m.56675 type:complete len:322 (-) Transcript_29504:377-1342(-)